MSRPLPSQIPESSFENIAKSHRQRLSSIWDPKILEESNSRKKLFLEWFAKSFSVSFSLRKVHIPRRLLKHWLGSDIDFVKSYNDIIEMWHDDIFASAAVRARGYLVADEKTESGVKEDANGAPIYHGADTNLTKSFLRAIDPAFNEKLEVTGKDQGPIQTDHKWTITVERPNAQNDST